MESIAGDLRLSQITLPGTHDSGARFETFAGTAKCQNFTIAQQLDIGVRFLDIRCRHSHDSFAIYHGSEDQRMSFGDVLDQVGGFLRHNPGECVILSLKEEHIPEDNTRSFEETFDSHVAAAPGKWWLGARVPALKDVRGKIVLLRRFAAAADKGINATRWPDNTSFRESLLCVQDHYRVGDNGRKWKLVEAACKAAMTDQNADILHLNFTSGYKLQLFGIPSIPAVSSVIGPQLADYFREASRGHYGCVIMDFADIRLTELIYRTNFKHLPNGAREGGK